MEENKELETLIHKIANNITHIDIVVDSLEEAIYEVNKLKAEGYDLFRGQSGLWPVVSNFNRLDEESREQIKRKTLLVEHFISKYDKTKQQDEIIAFLQHYGMPTNFVDFTIDPNVAAFFTTQISGKEPNKYACIICIETETVEAIIDIRKNEMPIKAEFIYICVENLLRQEAQKGKFLFLPFIGFEIALPYKRIIFMNSKDNAKKFKKSDFYPEEQSKVEQNIDFLVRFMNSLHVV